MIYLFLEYSDLLVKYRETIIEDEGTKFHEENRTKKCIELNSNNYVKIIKFYLFYSSFVYQAPFCASWHQPFQ